MTFILRLCCGFFFYRLCLPRVTYAGAKIVLETGRGDMRKVLNNFLCVLRLAGTAFTAIERCLYFGYQF